MKQIGRLFLGILCLTMGMTIAGCGNKEGKENTTTADNDAFTYSAKTLSGTIPDIDSLIVMGDRKYIRYYEKNQETKEYDMHVVAFEVTDGQAQVASQEIKLGQQGRYVEQLDASPAGGFVTVEKIYPETEEQIDDYEAYQKQIVTFLCRYDENGKLLMENDISDFLRQNQEYYINRTVSDEQGNICIMGDQKVYFMDAQGKNVGKADIPNWIDATCYGKSGKAYISYYDDASDKYVISQIDIANQKLNPMGTEFSYVRTMGAGIDKELLFVTDDTLQEYDIQNQTADTLCKLLDCDVVSDQLRQIYGMNNGTALLFTENFESNNEELLELRKLDASEVVEKQIITIANLYNDGRLNEYIVGFNKSNDKYRVTSKYYIDASTEWTENTMSDAVTAMQNDLVSGSGAGDVICLSEMLPVDALASKGVLEDLTPYIEASDDISLDDYLDKVIQASTRDGKVICLPRNFSIQTVIGKTAVVGDKEGWSLKDVEELSKKYPESSLFNYSSKESMLDTLLSMTWTQFMDESNGTCSFNQEAFKSILTVCAGYPDEYDWENDNKGMAAKIKDNDVLLADSYVYDFNGIQNAECYFEDSPITYIGYPTVDGSCGTIMNVANSYGILSKSKNKDGAWEFMKYVANYPYQSGYEYAFPSKKEAYREMKDSALHVEYLKDENGEYILDENGEKIPEGGGGGFEDKDGWFYEFHPVTQEEVDRVEYLIDISVPASTRINDNVIKIITEEAAPFFKGQKTVDEVCDIIQSRLSIYMKE